MTFKRCATIALLVSQLVVYVKGQYRLAKAICDNSRWCRMFNCCASCRNNLLPGERLTMNQFICSSDGRYRFGVASDTDVSLWDGSRKIWSGHTRGWKPYLIMQGGDGNAVLYSSRGPLWSTQTAGNPGASMHLEENGIAKVIDKQDNVVWTNDRCGYLDRTIRSVPLGPSPPGMVPVDASSLTNKVMAGYQGWFSTACDEGYGRPLHWSYGSVPSPDSCRFDMWPDMREYDADELCPTEFEYGNGTNAGLFSSYNSKTVGRHVKWMYEYGVDGVFVQRFVGPLKNDRCIRDKVLDNIRRGSEQYGRVFANMYDITGADPNKVYQEIKDDWMHLVDTEKITESDRYIYHNGLPVVAIWGFGFASRIGDPDKVAQLIQWFKNNPQEKYRATLMGGVPSEWRELGGNSKSNPDWADVYRSYDIISPWSVGRFGDNAGADKFRKRVTEPDLIKCQQLGIDYLPVVYPGYSFTNTNPTKPLNIVPRNGGNFFWRQIYNSIDAGSTQLYVAMFDEVDEGTAIFKVAETSTQAPVNSTFVHLDIDGFDVPSDWYLQLTGTATDMLRESGSVPSSMPALPPK